MIKAVRESLSSYGHTRAYTGRNSFNNIRAGAIDALLILLAAFFQMFTFTTTISSVNKSMTESHQIQLLSSGFSLQENIADFSN